MTFDLGAVSQPLHFARVRRDTDVMSPCIKVTLYKGSDGRIRAWFIGPLSWTNLGGVTMPYLPHDEGTIALVAILRADVIARAAGICVCIVDPHNLWTSIWKS